MKDALETLGYLIPDGESRDAVHLAVMPAVAAYTLSPGQHVGIGEDGACSSVIHIGIVDPFLKSPIKGGERFWLMLYPRTITSLRHVWTLPAIDGGPVVAEPVPPTMNTSEQWLRYYAGTIPVHYEELMSRAAAYIKSGDYWSEGGRFEGHWIPEEFWDHYEEVTGKAGEGNFFSCAC